MGRFTIFLTLLSLSQLSLGQPRHQYKVGYRHRANRDFIEKRDRITISDASFPEPTELPELVVYVDQYGNTISSATETIVFVPKETSPPEPTNPPAAPLSTTPPSPVSEPTLPVVTPASVPTEFIPESSFVEPSSVQQPNSEASVATPTAVPPPDFANQPGAKPVPQSFSGDQHGITYSPYKGNGNCKTADEVDRDFALFAREYGIVRIYGVDCNQVSTVSRAAKRHGNKLFLGIWDINSVDSSVATMAASLGHDWSMVDTVSVGNEIVNDGRASVGQSLAALSRARSALRAEGYRGPVVVVDTFVAVLSHPELCDQSDYCAINIHPFFDPNTGAHEAGPFVNSIMSNIKAKLSDPNKRIVVTETGWPWQGRANGAAVPGLDHQSTAISSIKSTFNRNAADIFLFTAFNDMWKKPDAGTFMAEQFWGMGGRYSPADQ